MPLVVQVGKWRRLVHLPEIEPCVENPLTDPNQPGTAGGFEIVDSTYPEGCETFISPGEETFSFFFFDLASCIQQEDAPPPPPR